MAPKDVSQGLVTESGVQGIEKGVEGVEVVLVAVLGNVAQVQDS